MKLPESALVRLISFCWRAIGGLVTGYSPELPFYFPGFVTCETSGGFKGFPGPGLGLRISLGRVGRELDDLAHPIEPPLSAGLAKTAPRTAEALARETEFEL